MYLYHLRLLKWEEIASKAVKIIFNLYLFTPEIDLNGGTVNSLTSWDEREGQRGELTCQGHIGSKWQSWASNSGRLAAEPVLSLLCRTVF